MNRHLLSFALMFPLLAAAQTHRVASSTPITRAVSVYEWTGELAKPTAARLVPVSLYIDGSLQDAGAFLARPIPLALLNDNIYSLEKSGAPAGTLTLSYARHLQAATSTTDNISDLGWFGYGVFAPLAADKPAKPLVATTVHGITSSKDADSTPDADVAKSRPTFSKKPADKSGVTPATSPDDDPDRPRLSKSAPASTTPATAPGDVDGGAPATGSKPADPSLPERKTDTTTPTPPDADVDRPTLRHRDPKQAEADRKARERGSVSALGSGPGSDPDRPLMRRGIATGAAAPPAQLSGLPPTLHQIVAVSDATMRPTHVFHREWDSAQEKSETETKLATIAEAQIATYTHGVTPAAPAPPTRTHTTHRAPPPPVALAFARQQVDGFQLEYGGLPTFVYQAETAAGQPGSPAPTLITVVAQRLPTGELQTALTSVTDGAHLDRTPQLRLVDAVDPDASNRASLLFELRGQTSRQFALYRLTGARAASIFVSNPSE